MNTYELWFNEFLGWFAVHLEEGQVTGICGPIHQATALDCEPSTFFYDERLEVIQRARESPQQFVPLELWLKGGAKYRPLPLGLDLVASVLGNLWSRVRRLLGIR